MPRIERIGIEDAIRVGVSLHKEGHIDEAEMVYRDILEAAPGQPDTLHFLGVLLHQRGRSEEGRARIEAALEVAPEQGGMWQNLGNVCFALQDLDAAERAYREAARIEPGAAEPLANLGSLLHAAGRRDEARAAFERALQIDPQHAETHHNLGNLLRQSGDGPGAIEHYRAAARHFTQMRSRGKATANLASALVRGGHRDEAERVLAEWREREPDNETARHMLAALTGQGVPLRASDIYVSDLFDGFADSFDESLAELAYRAPELIGAEIARRAGAAAGRWTVLDAGCGTGLGAPFLRPYASRLEGVDLSARMVDKARGRNAYDELHVGELTAFLTRRPVAFDLVACIDVLCYFGALDEVLGAVASALRPGGLLCFSVEKAATVPPGPGYRLEVHGRYAHHRNHLADVLAATGFVDAEFSEDVLRLEGGQGVAGWIVSARRGGG
jgi:predicted TPR repeat methyltransferase